MRRGLLLGCLLSAPSMAIAGSGPWVIGPGQGSVYLGVESQRLTRLAIVANGERDVIDVGQGLSTFAVKGIGTLGVTSRVEVEGQVPWVSVRANRPDEPLCAALGLDACETTNTVGVLGARVKGLVLDEYFGAPLSLAVGAEGRFGAFTADTRARITNAGEGTTDLGPFASVGRVGSLGGDAVISGHLTGGWRYRFPNTRAYPGPDGGDQLAPKPETWFDAELLAGPSPRFVLGPSATLLWRPGLDFGELDLTDPDRLAALGVTNVRVGGTAIVSGGGGLALAVSVLATAAARNNPTDVLSVNVGLAWRGGGPP